jgi:hypothetical protein
MFVDAIKVNMIKVKCIAYDDTNFKPNVVYNANNDPDDSDMYCIYDADTGEQFGFGGWYKHRFVIVSLEEPLSNEKSSKDDPEETRLWNLLKPNRANDECACGIKKESCNYHA